MRSSVRAVLLVAGVLLAIAWFNRERASEAPPPTSANPEAAVESTSATEGGGDAQLAVSDVRPADDESLESSAYATSDTAQVPPLPSFDAASSETGLVGRHADNYAQLLPRGATSTNGDDPSTEDEPATAFEGVNRFDCEFGEGFNSAAIWEGKVQSMGASWQGGPIVYDVIDAEGGTAQMIGSAGTTGSMDGQADAQVASGPDRIEFLARLDNGHLVFTTVFGRLDESGRHIAVMSRHEGGNFLGSQFRGSCR